jgi:peptidoglycan/LPS O-acetylase OafA/YrhL
MNQLHRFIELDSLRGLAAVTVVVSHFVAALGKKDWLFVAQHSPLRILFAGHEAVLIFFLLSGFVLSAPFSKIDRPRYLSYITKRICRIYLPYLAALALAVAGCYFFYSSIPTGNSWIDQTWNSAPAGHLVRQHVIMIGHYDDVQFNTAFWSLVVEMRVSIIFPLLFWLTKRIPFAILVPAAVLSTLTACAISDRLGRAGMTLTFLYAGVFIVGILLFTHLSAISEKIRVLSTCNKIVFLLVGLSFFEIPGAFASLYNSHAIIFWSGVRDWITTVGAAIILISAIEMTAFRHFLHRKVILRLGTISYSSYLVHATVLFIMIRLFLGKPYFALLFLPYLLVVYLLTELFYIGIERPCMILGRKLGQLLQSGG